MTEQALREGWQISKEALSRVPKKMLGILDTGSARDSIAAAKVLLMLAARNEASIPTTLHLHQHQPTPADKAETPKEDFDLERERQNNFERIARLRRFGTLDDDIQTAASQTFGAYNGAARGRNGG